MNPRLIVNADDFGLTAGVNRGIITAHQEGIVTSTTLMVNMPGCNQAIKLAKEHPSLAVGLHLNLTYGQPLLPASKVSTLVNPLGNFFKDPQYIQKQVPLDQIRIELAAQIQRFLATGLRLSHLDTHHHLHAEPRILDLLVEFAHNLKVPFRALNPTELLARGVSPRAQFVDFFASRDGLTGLLAIISNLAEGVTEIPCHPGYCDQELVTISTLNEARQQELQLLTNPLVLSTIKELGVKLTNYLEV